MGSVSPIKQLTENQWFCILGKKTSQSTFCADLFEKLLFLLMILFQSIYLFLIDIYFCKFETN